MEKEISHILLILEFKFSRKYWISMIKLILQKLLNENSILWILHINIFLLFKIVKDYMFVGLSFSWKIIDHDLVLISQENLLTKKCVNQIQILQNILFLGGRKNKKDWSKSSKFSFDPRNIIINIFEISIFDLNFYFWSKR